MNIHGYIWICIWIYVSKRYIYHKQIRLCLYDLSANVIWLSVTELRPALIIIDIEILHNNNKTRLLDVYQLAFKGSWFTVKFIEIITISSANCDSLKHINDMSVHSSYSALDLISLPFICMYQHIDNSFSSTVKAWILMSILISYVLQR